MPDVRRGSEATYSPTSPGSGNYHASQDHTQSVFRRQENDFFKKYRVFALRPGQNAGAGANAEVLSTLSPGQYEGHVISGVQRFVVVSDNPNEVWALPISSYRGNGTARQGVMKHHHGIVYTGKKEPAPDPTEAPARGEKGMLPYAVRVEPDLPTEKLQPKSRINYGQPTRIPQNTPVHNIGVIHRGSRAVMMNQYKFVHEQKQQQNAAQTPESSRAQQPVARSSLEASQQIPAGQARGVAQVQAAQIQAAHIQAAYQRLQNDGQPQQQIMQALTTQYRVGHPETSWADAAVIVHRLLSYRGPDSSTRP